MDLHHLGLRFFVSGTPSPATFHYAIVVRQPKLCGPAWMANFIPLASLFRAGAVVAGGSDHMVGLAPNTSINAYTPFLGMWIAITLKAADGTVINLFQHLSRLQALRMYTLNAAYLYFDM